MKLHRVIVLMYHWLLLFQWFPALHCQGIYTSLILPEKLWWGTIDWVGHHFLSSLKNMWFLFFELKKNGKEHYIYIYICEYIMCRQRLWHFKQQKKVSHSVSKELQGCRHYMLPFRVVQVLHTSFKIEFPSSTSPRSRWFQRCLSLFSGGFVIIVTSLSWQSFASF